MCETLAGPGQLLIGLTDGNSENAVNAVAQSLPFHLFLANETCKRIEIKSAEDEEDWREKK